MGNIHLSVDLNRPFEPLESTGKLAKSLIGASYIEHDQIMVWV